MAGFSLAIHVLPQANGKSWMPGLKPGMTQKTVFASLDEP